ncbi:MAG TPA: hypothetical protein VJR23_10025 [Candidatus Acidoferrales bacterium]|nr:hypothetical protein [Candidatus Acidoferrales bacterium]
MASDSILNKWKDSEKVVPVALVVLLLFFGNLVVDELMIWRGTQAAETFLDDLIIAALGGLTVWLLLTAQAKRLELRRARERMRITIELNRHVRSVFSTMANSMLLEDEGDRLRVADDAMQQIDRVLSDLVPEASAKEQPIPVERFSVTPSYRYPSRSDAARRN